MSRRCGAKMLIDIRPLSKFNTDSFVLRGNPAGKKTYKHHIFTPSAGAR